MRHLGFERLMTARKAIDELHFVHVRLGLLLKALVRRVPEEPVGRVLSAHHRSRKELDAQLVSIAFEYGMPVRPCVCAEAEALLEHVYHQERSALREHRIAALLDGLKQIHNFLLRTWRSLLDQLRDGTDGLFDACVRLQAAEAALHRDLIDLGDRSAA